MYTVFPENTFIKDMGKWSKEIPNLWDEVDAVINVIIETGTIPKEYDPHFLDNPNLNYAGYFDLHLFEGKIDLVIIYTKNNKKRTFRFVRLGSHNELFHRELK